MEFFREKIKPEESYITMFFFLASVYGKKGFTVYYNVRIIPNYFDGYGGKYSFETQIFCFAKFFYDVTTEVQEVVKRLDLVVALSGASGMIFHFASDLESKQLSMLYSKFKNRSSRMRLVFPLL